MRCVYSPAHLLHHPEHEVQLGSKVAAHEVPARAEMIRSALERDGGFEFSGPRDHGTKPIVEVHEQGLLRYLENAWSEWRAFSEVPEFWPDTILHPALLDGMGEAPEPTGQAARLGYWCFETMTPLTPGVYPAARAAVDVALTAADLVLTGDEIAYGLCRPPGHHAVRSAYGGYCYLNNAAVAAQYLHGSTGERVAVLDVDYHHGNGIQQIFYGQESVLYVSLHGDPNHAYPYFTGFADETGAGKGEGANLNLPLPRGCTAERYFTALERALDVVDASGSPIVVVSLGLDTYGGDPIADFSLTTAHLHEMGRRVGSLRSKLVVLQEGGYRISRLGANACQWLRGAEGRDLDLRSQDETLI
jgi:acetoin utilization deacetylase AcuC-like enzyme